MRLQGHVPTEQLSSTGSVAAAGLKVEKCIGDRHVLRSVALRSSGGSCKGGRSSNFDWILGFGKVRKRCCTVLGSTVRPVEIELSATRLLAT